MTSKAMASNTALTSGWKWRARVEGNIAPATMETRHLFYTLRMIWNHTMPSRMAVGDRIKRWILGPLYQPEYLREAIVHIGHELSLRDDLAPLMRDELEQMARWSTRLRIKASN